MSTDVGIDTSQLKDFVAQLGERFEQLPDMLFEVLRQESMALAAEIKKQIPVWTGRSRASWGMYTPEDLATSPPPTNIAAWVQRRSLSSSDDAIWVEDRSGFTILQGSNVETVESMENGSFPGVAAGFIDQTAEAYSEKMGEQMTDIISEFLSA